MQQEQLAAATVDAARAAFLPQVAAQGGWELNGGAWNSRSSSWVAGAVARINLFHGLADKARLAEAREQATRRALEKDKAETMARLDVQIAIARLEAARASEAVGRAAADQARESRRIIRDRYESGLTDAAIAAALGRSRAAGRCPTNRRACERAHRNRDPATSDRKAMKHDHRESSRHRRGRCGSALDRARRWPDARLARAAAAPADAAEPDRRHHRAGRDDRRRRHDRRGRRGAGSHHGHDHGAHPGAGARSPRVARRSGPRRPDAHRARRRRSRRRRPCRALGGAGRRTGRRARPRPSSRRPKPAWPSRARRTIASPACRPSGPPRRRSSTTPRRRCASAEARVAGASARALQAASAVESARAASDQASTTESFTHDRRALRRRGHREDGRARKHGVARHAAAAPGRHARIPPRGPRGRIAHRPDSQRRPRPGLPRDRRPRSIERHGG